MPHVTVRNFEEATSNEMLWMIQNEYYQVIIISARHVLQF